MDYAFDLLLLCLGLFVAILLSQAVGHYIGGQVRRRNPELGGLGSAAAQGAVFGLLGLLIAFTFSGAASRFEDRRHLLTQEANAIGTAWLRLDLLPPDAQPSVRDLFRDYLDARLAFYRDLNVPGAEARDATTVAALQKSLWSAAVRLATAPGAAPDAAKLLLPALNETFDISTTRAAARQNHPPRVIFGMLVVLGALGGLLIGYELSGGSHSEWLHRVVYAAVLSVTLYVILDLEYPRRGLIRVDDADQLLVQLREQMK